MASKGKEKATLAKEFFLTYTDLVKKEKSGERTQITEGHSARADGIECIKAYHMQFTRLTTAERDEMRSFIADVHYAVPPSAEGVPSSQKLYKSQHKSITKAPESLSWPILRYSTRDTACWACRGHWEQAEDDKEEGSGQGKAESEKELAEKKKRQLAMLEEMKNQEEGAREQEDREESMQSDDMKCGGLFGKTAQKRPASPTPLRREERRDSGED
ncbi:hypothetical protein Trisim1_000785 [Trichoderma cf. simile WF8]